jgi:hypothetical protein
MRVPFGVSRREWLTGCLALVGGTAAAGSSDATSRAEAAGLTAARRRRIDSVSGPIDPADLGVTLMHEHVLVDFIGARDVSASRYDADAVFTRALPHLRQVKRWAARRSSTARPRISDAIRAC